MKRMKPKVLNRGQGEVRIYQSRRNSFEIRYKIGKHKKRETRKSLELAEIRAEQILGKMENGEDLHIDPKELQMLQYLLAEAEKWSTDLVKVWKYWEENHRQQNHAVGSVVVAFLQDQEARKVSPVTIKTNRSRLVPLVSAFGDGKASMNHITVSQLDEWLQQSFANMTTRKNHRAAIVQLWRWATRKNYLPDRQFTEADKTSVPIVEHCDPTIYTAEEMKILFQYIHAHYPTGVPAVILAGWAGIRNAEIYRLKWRDIDLPTGSVGLTSSITKTGRRRTAIIAPDALDCLKIWCRAFRPDADQMVTHGFSDRCITEARDKLSIAVKSNGFRKSYISHAVALGEKPVAQIAEECGHAVAILQTTYKGLVGKDEAKRWFSIPAAV